MLLCNFSIIRYYILLIERKNNTSKNKLYVNPTYEYLYKFKKEITYSCL